MKLVRYINQENEICLGAWEGVEYTACVKKIVGDWFDGFSVTEENESVEKLLAPLEPEQIICIGLNYKLHADEMGAKMPQYPILFMKNIASVQNPFDPIELPRISRSDEVDYEAELAIVIGRKCKNVQREKALDYVLGFTCANDVSARDWQMKRSGRQWCRAKSFDTFCPLGPWIVTRDELIDPDALNIRCIVNGEVLQESNTNDMIFNVSHIISFLSQSMTLLPGTVILTGTPSGVGMGRSPQVWLKHGDRVIIEIEKIGKLENPVIEEVV
ncbi:MAG: fumarylacetoacetate hydrolase family protein [Verrucomicrobiota bacterium]